MKYRSLWDFVKVLSAEGELIRTQEIVSPCLEIPEITDRESKRFGGGKALLFERVEGSPFPVLTNAFGSEKRVALALGAESPAALGDRLRELLEQPPPQTLGEKVTLLKKTVGLGRYFPRLLKTSRAPCQAVILTGGQVDLTKLPVLTCWPQDAGPFITLPVVFTKSLRTGRRNAGMYRMQVFDRNTTGMHWHIHKDGAHHFREYLQAGKRMEVAVAIGADPAITYAATAPLPPGIDEMILAGFICREPVRMVRGITVDIEVPADAEIIIEGYVDPAERRREGPFGDHTGYYSLPDDYPVLHVTAVTHRRNALYSATVVGRPPMEDCYLAQVTERLFLPLVRTVLPEIRDYWMPWEGVFHNLTIVAVEKEYPGQIRKVSHGLWGSGQMSFCKTIVAVDGGTPLRDGKALLAKILDTIDLASDIFFTEGVLDVLDHSAPNPLFGGKMGVDATARTAGEPPRGPQTAPVALPGAGELLTKLKTQDESFLACHILCADTAHPLVLLTVGKNENKGGSFFADLLAKQNLIPPACIAVLFDADMDLGDDSALLWRACNNVDPRRDIAIRDNRAVIDATRKGAADGHRRPWPEDAVMSREVKARVTKRSRELGISRNA
ncbi:MAG: menaquinone biosynthesis decarboxylase [Deltaproteobacteria bacterium]|nr:menaquinone biosynthesis decarboxylase [Deltaproteobacteria bacterium]